MWGKNHLLHEVLGEGQVWALSNSMSTGHFIVIGDGAS